MAPAGLQTSVEPVAQPLRIRLGVTTQHSITNTILLIPFFVALLACQPPSDPEKPSLDTETGIGGGESGVEEDDFKADGYCLVAAIDGVKGYRHHCGGTMEFEVEGQYHSLGSWHPTSFGMDIGFGPTFADDWLVDDDTYDRPLVAACCGGPMDFENTDSNYFNAYQLNCALDGIQQLCSALPRYFKALADTAIGVKKLRYYDIAKHLNDDAVQNDCVLSLYEESDPDNAINGTTWRIIDSANANYTLIVEHLEILDIDYDEPPAECKSIYDNDDNVTPLIESLTGSSVEPFTLSAGDGQFTNNDDVTAELDPEPDSVLATSLDVSSGALQLVNFALKGSNKTIVVDSIPYTVDRWSLRLMTPVTAPRGKDGTYTYPEGRMTILATVFAAGDAISLIGTNATDVTIVGSSSGWLVRGFQVEYNESGTLWSWSQASDLNFD